MMIDVPSDAPNFTFTVANESPSRLLTWPEASLPATAVTGRIKASTRRALPWAARSWAASCSLPGPGWISTSVLPLALRQVPPRGSRPAHPQQGVDEPVVVDRHVAPLSRQQVRDPHEPVKRDAIPRRTHTPIITQNLDSVNTP